MKIIYLSIFFLCGICKGIAQNMIINGGFEDAQKSSFTDNPNEFLDPSNCSGNGCNCSGHVAEWGSSYGSPDITYGSPNSGQYVTNQCGVSVISIYSFDCCPIPQLSTVNIEICNKSFYQLGPQAFTFLSTYGYIFQWTATNPTDLNYLSSTTIIDPSITLDPNNPLPTFPMHLYLTGTNACGVSFSQEYILDGNPQQPIVHYISPGYCWNASVQAYVSCNPFYHSSTQILELPYQLSDQTAPPLTIEYKQLVVEVYNGGVLLGNPIIFNYDDPTMINQLNNNLTALAKNNTYKLNTPINIDCTKSIGVVIYYRRDCDIFPLLGFDYGNTTLCIY
ncbi:MAG: hypothetical protein SGJ10_04335 [Bacteroidota bacterium]|nr:hypothetical protein [Bacteroidota bacterium]